MNGGALAFPFSRNRIGSERLIICTWGWNQLCFLTTERRSEGKTGGAEADKEPDPTPPQQIRGQFHASSF